MKTTLALGTELLVAAPVADLAQSLQWPEEIATAHSERTANIIKDRIAGR